MIEMFNQGVEMYRAKDFQSSEQKFDEVVAQTDDEKIKQKALYNRGTALLAGTVAEQLTNRLDSVSLSIKLFEQALELDSTDLDAKQNLERALNLIVTSRIKQAAKLISEADQLLTQDQAKAAKENYETAIKTIDPVQEDFAPNHPDIEPLLKVANEQLNMLEHTIELTREDMENAKHAIDLYQYQTAAKLMLDDKPERRWAFDLDEKLAQEFQQMIQNNQNIINIIYPPNPLKP